ncbi:MAG: NAD-dependent epimerase/dehydratase family protein [Actinomycetota bacterium]|nr:NAD-dependent epimerase/dehydratase family protein [Actinomycetota bacterium]
MRVLVTGGAGFIGSHVVDALLAGGATVRVVDSLAAHGTVPDHLDRRVELLVGEVADPAVAEAAVAGIDAVCHQAAKVGLGLDFGDVSDYAAANDLGTARLLEALWRRSFSGRLVLASSMVVYGEGRYRCATHGDVRPPPRTEADLAAGCFDPPCPRPGCRRSLDWAAIDEASPLDPRNVYAATKVHQEQLCALWGREAGATVVALRYHNVYGPRMPHATPYAGVASLFRSALVDGRAPEVFEDGGQYRDFVHVRDVARANVLALTRPDVASGAYNVASGTPHTVGELATALSAALDPRFPPQVTGRWRSGDVRHVVAAPARAAEALDFVAEIGFADGMAEFARARPSGAGPRGGGRSQGGQGRDLPARHLGGR